MPRKTWGVEIGSRIGRYGGWVMKVAQEFKSQPYRTNQFLCRFESCPHDNFKPNKNAMKKLVTKDWLAARLRQPDRQRVLGRALVAIFNRQEALEQNSTATLLLNGRGFSKPDARIGTLGAKAFMATGKVPYWNQNIWLRADKTGYPRICKYAAQLDQVAKQKQQIV